MRRTGCTSSRSRFARLPDDVELLERAHARAGLLLREDPELAAPEHALLAQRTARVEAGALAG